VERPFAVGGGRLTTVSPKASASSRGRRAPKKPITQNLMQHPAVRDTLDQAALIRELNHRVKNNFQIIVSLMNLRKRMMPAERREDIRFIEEHVQSMSVAYRLVYGTGSMIEVSLTELVTEVLSGLRQIAGLSEDRLRIDLRTTDTVIALDPAIALALYLAVLLPPYLDEAIATAGVVTITVSMVSNLLVLSVRATWPTPVALDALRGRLMQAYAAQLKAKILSATIYGTEQLCFMLERPVLEQSKA
jgi:hypothetical protein